MIFSNPVELTPTQLLSQQDHRPYPLPERPWAMAQSWQRLLFAHWPVPAAALRPLIPPELAVDTFDSSAWLSLVPFRMTGVRLRWLPPIPPTGTFPELNLRTYVTYKGIGGVWFFSLEAASSIAVTVARRWYRLPYYHAAMRIEEQGDHIAYSSRRTHRGAPRAQFAGEYHPSGPLGDYPRAGIERWLAERYALFTAARGRIYRGDIHHRLWPLRPAEAEFHQETISAAAGFDMPRSPALVQYVHHIDMLAWPLMPV